MKLSKDTINILKYFASINGSIKIDPGNKIYSKAESGAMVSYCEVDEEFDVKFVTTNLEKFLQTAGLLDDPEYEFNDEYVILTSGKNSTKFYLSNEALVNQTNKIPAPQSEIALNFKLDALDLKKIFKASNVLGVSDIIFTGKDGKVSVSVMNKSMKTTNTFKTDIAECKPDLDVQFLFKKNNFNIMDCYDYDVEISPNGLAKFTALNSPYKKLETYVVVVVDVDD